MDMPYEFIMHFTNRPSPVMFLYILFSTAHVDLYRRFVVSTYVGHIWSGSYQQRWIRRLPYKIMIVCDVA